MAQKEKSESAADEAAESGRNEKESGAVPEEAGRRNG